MVRYSLFMLKVPLNNNKPNRCSGCELNLFFILFCFLDISFWLTRIWFPLGPVLIIKKTSCQIPPLFQKKCHTIDGCVWPIEWKRPNIKEHFLTFILFCIWGGCTLVWNSLSCSVGGCGQVLWYPDCYARFQFSVSIYHDGTQSVLHNASQLVGHWERRVCCCCCLTFTSMKW